MVVIIGIVVDVVVGLVVVAMDAIIVTMSSSRPEVIRN